MPAIYTINIVNQTDEAQTFQIFPEPPNVTGAVNTIWINSLAKVSNVGPNLFAVFSIPTQYYAVCGISGAPLGEGIAISTESIEPVVLGTSTSPGSDWKVTVQNTSGSGPFFTASDAADSHVPGGFTINTLNESWIPSQHPTAFVGVGRQDPINPGSNNVIPVATWKPKPNQTYQVRPNLTYWVVYGNIAPGLHESVWELGVVPFKVDFTGSTDPTATLTLQPDYTWRMAWGHSTDN